MKIGNKIIGFLIICIFIISYQNMIAVQGYTYPTEIQYPFKEGEWTGMNMSVYYDSYAQNTNEFTQRYSNGSETDIYLSQVTRIFVDENKTIVYIDNYNPISVFP